jgi:ABC-2 type transport system ATP-binding protein
MNQEGENVISVENIWRYFKTYKKEAGLWASIKSVIKREYVTKAALKGVSLTVNKGEILGLIGPNGAGKSTLIKILSGVLYPTSGSVQVMGYEPWKDRMKYTKHLGVVFGQKSSLWWDIPAVDSFELNKGLYEISDEDYDRRLKFMIDLLDAEELVNKPVRQLSLGERMRCEIIQSLLHNPKVVFFDEPTIGLDTVAKEKMRNFIKEINRRYGTTFIITTHDMGDIEKLCERVVVINHGIIVYDGMLKELRKKFANRKIIDCMFLEPILARKFDVKGCKVMKRNKHQLILELDLRKNKLRNVIDRIMDRYGSSMEDMIISDPPIEEIISIIYKK